MLEPPIPANESQRLEALRAHRLLDTDPEDELDRITKLLSQNLGVPIALVSLIDEHRQWFKSRIGLDATETPREISFCGHAVASGETLIVENALEDERFHDNPLVEGSPDIRFYAGRPLRTSDGAILGTLCAIDREPKKLTKEQEFVLNALADVAERYLDLRHRMNTLTSADSEFERMVAMAVHDLKNPLSAVVGLSQLLKVMGDEPEKRDIFLDRMISSAMSLDTMLINLLHLVTQKSSTLQANSSPGDICALVRSIANEMAVVAAEKDQDITTDITCQVETSVYDEYLITRLLQNLLMNAMQHSGRTDAIALGAKLEGSDLVLWVADLGRGIPDEEKATIFEPYKRLDKKSGSNKGLGLTFSKMAAEAHGGTLTIEDNQPKGTKFVVRLPQPESAK